MNVGVIGAGLIGRRRAEIAVAVDGTPVISVADTDAARARSLAELVGARSAEDWREVVRDDAVEAVVVATTNDALCEVTVAAMEAGKHVLCEKPLGRNVPEARMMVAAARRSGKILKTGFTVRHHPAVREARGLLASGELGEPIWVRAAYGHGGRAGYEREWRCNPEVSGGGELLDQGVHLVDLARWFLGPFEEVKGTIATHFWPIAPLEDNAFLTLRTGGGQVAFLHASWTQWKNRFEFEVCAREGFARIEGIGGSYGPETLRVGKRRPEGGAPEVAERVFDDPMLPWREEWRDFVEAVRDGREANGTGRDGLEAMRIIDAALKASRTGRGVMLREIPGGEEK